MKILINNVTVNSLLKGKATGMIIDHLNLLYPAYYEDGTVVYTAELDVSDKDFSIINKYDGSKECIIIDMHSVGSLELNVNDYSSITLV